MDIDSIPPPPLFVKKLLKTHAPELSKIFCSIDNFQRKKENNLLNIRTLTLPTNAPKSIQELFNKSNASSKNGLLQTYYDNTTIEEKLEKLKPLWKNRYANFYSEIMLLTNGLDHPSIDQSYTDSWLQDAITNCLAEFRMNTIKHEKVKAKN